MKPNDKKLIAGLVLAVVLLAGIWMIFRTKGVEGEKSIQVTVVYEAGNEESFALHTDAAYLRQALEEQDLISGEEGPYGLFVTTVNGVTADESKQQWWCFTKSRERLDTSVDQTPVSDGDQFEITLTTGY